MITLKHWTFVAVLVLFSVAFVFIGCDVGSSNNNDHTCTFGDWTQTTAPDCTSAGTKTRVCTVCGTPDTATHVGDAALGHNWVDGECERCGIIEPEPVEFLRLTFEGNTTVLKAMADIDPLKIDAIAADTNYAFDNLFSDGNRRTVVTNIASWVLIGEVADGDWEIIDYTDDGRTIVVSNGSFERLVVELLAIGRHIEDML